MLNLLSMCKSSLRGLHLYLSSNKTKINCGAKKKRSPLCDPLYYLLPIDSLHRAQVASNHAGDVRNLLVTIRTKRIRPISKTDTTVPTLAPYSYAGKWCCVLPMAICINAVNTLLKKSYDKIYPSTIKHGTLVLFRILSREHVF